MISKTSEKSIVKPAQIIFIAQLDLESAYEGYVLELMISKSKEKCFVQPAQKTIYIVRPSFH